MRVFYALAGQGRGHSSRVWAMTTALRARGHAVQLCGGGLAREVMTARGEEVVEVPALEHTLDARRRIDLPRSGLQMGRALRSRRSTLATLTARMADFRPDLVVTDFEVFSIRAAERLSLPVVAFNHQAVCTHTRLAAPQGHRLDALVNDFVVRLASPRRPAHTLISSFYFPPVKDPTTTTLVGPVLRQEVLQARPERGDHVLAYVNDPAGQRPLLDALAATGVPVRAYGFGTSSDLGSRWPTVSFEAPGDARFLEDLRTARAVVATAGYTLISEALFLGKPLLVNPNRGLFEQTLNALQLEQAGLGQAVVNRDVEAADVRRLLRRAERAAPARRLAFGNADAVACLERIAGQYAPNAAVPDWPVARPRLDAAGAWGYTPPRVLEASAPGFDGAFRFAAPVVAPSQETTTAVAV